MRRVLLVLAVAIVAAGCLGTGGGSDRVRADGSPATLAPDAAAAAGYERVATRNRTLNATVTVTLQGDVEGRESKDVTATVPVTTYRMSGDPPAVVAVVSSPSVEVIENPPKSRDPLATLSTAELVTFVQPTYAAPADLERTGTRTVTALEAEGELVSHRGTATYDGSTVEVQVHVARIPHDGDVVTVVALAPAGSDHGETVGSLLDDLRH